MRKKVLLVGGAGYVGSVITSRFLKKGYKVNVLDNFVYDNHFSIQPYIGDPDYQFFLGDINDNLALDNASEGVTDVIILAGLVGDPITKSFPEESCQINEKGVQNVMDYFNGRGLDKLIFISTCSNYGLIKDDQLADEKFELNPLSLYAKAKVANEAYLMEKKEMVDYTGIVFRFATAFGLSPRMRFDLSVSEFVRDVFFGEELLVYDEHTWRPYCHVRDFARLLDIAINAPKENVNFEVFNAGGDINNFTKKMIVNEILSHIPEGDVKFGKQGSDPRNYKVNFNKVKSVLNFEPEFTVQHGIKELIEALKIGLYSDTKENKNKYGNYKISY
ncbi:NAD(P)-dependent oxidoreductase [Lentimicrobium sp. S6]|uniref:NAD-dependent epimerase/dehydratase family protein n=1 Tax=Lentimicrobium sp. S6 TaxID=2735872 RepID=UPI00155664B6|nr:NAD(P)-dependent oxidoreductase [Lentimicrobium sp. S6]NPD46748.1 NAD(P)-dependent oxidoreductase [Lentimicrobium sp. S6]